MSEPRTRVEAALDLLHEKPRAIVLLHGGINSTVFHLRMESGHDLVAKAYPVERSDHRDRLSTEVLACYSLRLVGMRDVPESIVVDSVHRIGFFGYVEGERPTPASIGKKDVRAAAEFVLSIQAHRGELGLAGFQRASEACYSLPEHVKVIEDRIAALLAAWSESSEARRFVSDEVRPCLTEVLESGPPYEGRVPDAERILSPSDFGFHNSIRRPDGVYTFLDLEYFGWDDPAKLLCDAFLQPDFPIPAAHRPLFFETVWRGLGSHAYLPRRFERLYPLLAIKWALIVLNAFLPERRGVADPARLAGQMRKARAAISEARRTMKARDLSGVLAS